MVVEIVGVCESVMTGADCVTVEEDDCVTVTTDENDEGGEAVTVTTED